MSAVQHAISESARRPSFWPSVAEASSLVQQRVVAHIGRAQATSPAVRRPGPPGAAGRYHVAGGSR